MTRRKAAMQKRSPVQLRTVYIFGTLCIGIGRYAEGVWGSTSIILTRARASTLQKNVPQGLKASSVPYSDGTAEAAPFVLSFCAACKKRSRGFENGPPRPKSGLTALAL